MPAELPPVEVTADPPANKKADGPPAKSSGGGVGKVAGPTVEQDTEPQAAPPTETTSGLNLTRPDTTGSRLNLTPLETPASVEVIPGDTIRERAQTSVNDAVIQNATGFTSTASPGNGWTGLGTRGFTGHNSVMQLYDGTRLYVASGTVTFPFDTWSAERIEVLRVRLPCFTEKAQSAAWSISFRRSRQTIT